MENPEDQSIANVSAIMMEVVNETLGEPDGPSYTITKGLQYKDGMNVLGKVMSTFMFPYLVTGQRL